MLLSSNYKKNFKSLAPVFSWVVFIAAVYLPFLVYRMNSQYFSEKFIVLVIPILGLVVPLMMFILLILAFLPKKLMPYVTSVLTLSAFFIWFQGDLFSISYGQIDGLGMLFYPHEFRGLVEVIILTIGLFIAIKFHSLINRFSPPIIIFIFLAQFTIVSIYIAFEKKEVEHEYIDNEIFTFSTKDNVIVIILDAFGSDFFQMLLNEDESIKTKLKGFVNYSDAISQYPQTKSSLASFLTGELIPEGAEYRKYLTEEVANLGLPKHFEKQGYLVSVVSTAYIWFKDFYKQRFMYQPPAEKVFYSGEAMKLFDYGLFRMVPHIYKHKIYNKGFWLVSDFMTGYNRLPDIYPTRSIKMIEYYFSNLIVKGTEPRFKILHFTIPHPKFVFNQNCEFNSKIEFSEDAMFQQSKCALSKLLMMLELFKSKQIYDDSLIIVMSDHGAKMYKNESEVSMPSDFEIKSSGSLLMIKDKQSYADLKQDDTPVSLLGVSEFLSNLHEHEELSRLKAEDQRFFHSYRTNTGSTRSNIPNGILYGVDSDYSDLNSWFAIKTVTNKCQLNNHIGSLQIIKGESNAICYKFGLKGDSESKNGLELIAKDGLLAWKTRSVIRSNKSLIHEIKIQIESDVPVTVRLNVNNDSLTNEKVDLNSNGNMFTAQLSQEIFQSETKFELFISKSNTHDADYTSSKTVIKSIELLEK